MVADENARTLFRNVVEPFGAHGANERAPVKWLPAGTDFLRNVVKQLVQ